MRPLHLGMLTWFILASAPLYAAPASSTDSSFVRSTSPQLPIRWVSQSALSASSLDELPLQDSCKKALRSDLLLAGTRERAIFGAFPGPSPPSEAAKPLQEYLQLSPNVVLARVVNVEVGWDCHYGMVARRIDIEVEERVNGALEPGARFVLIERGGELILDGKAYNWGGSKGLPALQVGIELLVGGYVGTDTEPMGLAGGIRLRVLDGQVEPVASPYLRDRERVDLSSLLAALRAHGDE